MGNTHPLTPPINNFNPNQWILIYQDPNTKILTNRKNNNQIIQQHSILIVDNHGLGKAQELYQMRYNDPQLVSSSYINIDIYQQLCSKLYCGSIFTQHIPLRLSNITQIPFPDILHLYNQCFNGFHRLAKQLGYFTVYQNSIGINSNNVVKVWINSNFSEIWPDSIMHSEGDMVRNIVELIQSNTNISTMPNEQPSFSKFLYKDNTRIRFQQAKLKLQHYAINYNKGVIPNHLSCIKKSYITHYNPLNNLNPTNHITCTNQTLVNGNQYQGQYLGRQHSKTLIHCSSAQSLSTVDAATQTHATDKQIYKIPIKIGNNVSNTKFNPSDQLIQSNNFHHPKSKPQLSINFFSHPPPPLQTPTHNHPNIFISSPKTNQSPFPSYSLSRSQSQSKLNHPNSKLESQPVLIRSGTLKMFHTHNYTSIGNMYQQGKKQTQNQNINVQKISKNKVQPMLSVNKLTLNQLSISNHINQQNPNKNINKLIDSQPKNLNSNPKSTTPISLKLSQSAPPPPQPTTPQIPLLNFHSPSNQQLNGTSTFQFPLSSRRRSRQDQQLMISSRTNHSNSMSSAQKNRINKSIYQPPENQHFIHHNQLSSNPNNNISLPHPYPSQNPQSLHQEPPAVTPSPITTQAPTSTSTSTLIKHNQFLSTQLTPHLNPLSLTFTKSINPPIQINIKSKLTLTPQINDQVSMISSEQFVIFNNSQEKDCSEQFTISHNHNNPTDYEFKIPSQSIPDQEFRVNQSISSITHRQDQDNSGSYIAMEWQNQGEHHPCSSKTLVSPKIDEIYTENKCETSCEIRYKEENNKNNNGEVVGQGNYDNYSFRKNINEYNHLQNSSSRGNNSSFSCPKTYGKQNPSPANYLSPKYDNGGTAASYTPTYSTSQQKHQKSSTNNLQFPKPSQTVQITSSHPNYSKTMIELLCPQKQSHKKSSLTDNLPYNIEWDPQILADLKATMLIN